LRFLQRYTSFPPLASSSCENFPGFQRNGKVFRFERNYCNLLLLKARYAKQSLPGRFAGRVIIICLHFKAIAHFRECHKPVCFGVWVKTNQLYSTSNELHSLKGWFNSFYDSIRQNNFFWLEFTGFFFSLVLTLLYVRLYV
jgi:hypothetical protein